MDVPEQRIATDAVRAYRQTLLATAGPRVIAEDDSRVVLAFTVDKAHVEALCAGVSPRRAPHRRRTMAHIAQGTIMFAGAAAIVDACSEALRFLGHPLALAANWALTIPGLIH